MPGISCGQSVTQPVGRFACGREAAHVGNIGTIVTDRRLRPIGTGGGRGIGRTLPFGQQHVQQTGPVPGAQGFQQA